MPPPRLLPAAPRINRLSLFWFDDLSNYENERSLWLAALRDRVEAAWQAWELGQVSVYYLSGRHWAQAWSRARAQPGPSRLSNH
jgi:hypothetical protein